MKRAIAKKSDGMRYLTKRPRSIAPGRVLVHNHISHTVDMESGENGFRFWTLPEGELSRHFKRCKCGWSGLPHYRRREEDKRVDALHDRCITHARLDQINRAG
jgi:hypothetical protein